MNDAAGKRLTGRIAAERIRMMEVPRPPEGAVARFLALGDPSGVVSDVKGTANDDRETSSSASTTTA